jgi:hypothetical protein
MQLEPYSFIPQYTEQLSESPKYKPDVSEIVTKKKCFLIIVLFACCMKNYQAYQSRNE